MILHQAKIVQLSSEALKLRPDQATVKKCLLYHKRHFILKIIPLILSYLLSVLVVYFPIPEVYSDM